MKILANENIPLGLVRLLREVGHDVVSISECSPGISDTDVLNIARREVRVLLTFDRDYGELIYLKHLPCPASVMYLRFVPSSPDDAFTFIAPLLRDADESITGYFVVVDKDSYRKRPLPKPLD
jgi:predicted nuclease of predicted toxin-antitoxin system